jgi:hypothetical protein
MKTTAGNGMEDESGWKGMFYVSPYITSQDYKRGSLL